MPLETPINYIPDLNPANPAVADGLGQGDDHLRGIKTALKNTLPNFTGAALVSSQAEIDAVAHTKQFSAQNGTSTAPSVTFTSDLTAGFYKGARTGQTAIAGTLRGSGAVAVGALVDFPLQPPSRFTVGGTANGGQAAVDWIELDGSVYNIADYPDLAAFLGSAFGGNGTTTFGVPNCTNTGRYRRSRTSGTAAGSYQANLLGSHTHTGSADAAGAHSHTATVSDPQHSHTLGTGFVGGAGTASGGNPNGGTQTSVTTSAASTGITVALSTDGSHGHSLTINATGGTETRPETFIVVSCIKT